jgi:hypothetical protein
VNRPFSVLAAVCLASLLASSVRADLVIDGFDSPFGGQVASDSTIDGMPDVSTLAGQPVIGGSREIFASTTSQIGGGTQPVKGSSNEFNTGIFNFDQYSATARGSVSLVYDGNANGVLNTMGLGGIDLTQGGTNVGFLIQNLNVTGSGLQLSVNLYNAATGALFSSGPVSLVNGFSGSFLLLYGSFTGPGGVSTPTNVGAIEVVVDGSNTVPIDAAGSDLTFTIIQSASVPEPSSMVLCGLLSLAGVGGHLRRRRTAAAA